MSYKFAKANPDIKPPYTDALKAKYSETNGEAIESEQEHKKPAEGRIEDWRSDPHVTDRPDFGSEREAIARWTANPQSEPKPRFSLLWEDLIRWEDYRFIQTRPTRPNLNFDNEENIKASSPEVVSLQRHYQSLEDWQMDPNNEDRAEFSAYAVSSSYIEEKELEEVVAEAQTYSAGMAPMFEDVKETEAKAVLDVAEFNIEKGRQAFVRAEAERVEANDLSSIGTEERERGLITSETLTQTIAGETEEIPLAFINAHENIFLKVDKTVSPWWKGVESQGFKYLSDSGFSDSASANWNDIEVLGRSEAYKSFQSTSNREISFTLKLIAEEDPQQEVKLKALWLRSLQYPTYEGDIMYPPPLCWLTFGDLFPGERGAMRGIVTDTSIQWGAEGGFYGAEELYAMAAEVSITFTVVNESPLSAEQIVQ